MTASSLKESGRAVRHVRVVGLAVVVVVLAVAAAVLDLPDPEQLRGRIDGNGVPAPLVFFAVCAVGTAAFFPKPVLAAASGLLFGVLPGLAIAVAGFTAGAVIAFFVARLLGRPWVARWLGSGRLKALDAVFARDGLAATVVLRLLPVVPFAVSNYGAGVTAVAPTSFAAGTALGLLPTTALAATLGDAALDLGSPRSIAAGAAWLVLALVGVWWGRRLLLRSKA
ncbi:TVP38/TMEM64 family protein [Saccharothrix sp. 6-C]|uniref:TVP38/TMEM64 family protein n=1 Tax=Saccharothrix sp. 6-C TaxID=2781735 RepID=UPI001916E82C|nr:TVP38/TMEM64 family protein [Saccharothrix sp. 6-C]QQQ73694.1 TVP38/TMEM64 family protein [Saccharothrix sp. 6-C]